ncbi:RDD family protein [Streptomyces sp. NBC_01754]|uniref:RDD family protein n=1 Tax=Streptomyces sp. NBC_01754 TaxID=2975930 RepID=UPI002DDA70F2|nr:RDD family protein [Streptomyces sp. NBC_01754]WSC92794.1 RDD family protein [Streptomyces sp. NBC_01754]
MSDLVTGDAVVLGLQPARLPSRALATAIDLAVLLISFLLLSIGLAVVTASIDAAAQAALGVAVFLLVLVGGPVAVETLSNGRSLGKVACGLRVVRDDGGPIRFRHALVRGAMGLVELLGTFGVVACVSSLVSARGRRLGDVFAGTLVVRERVPAGRATVVPPPPPWLVGRFTQLDLSTVPDGLWLAVRQYLTRMHQLDAAVGWSIAERLAADLVACTGTPVPQGVPAAAYLAAVVNERQTRDVRRVGASTGHGAHPYPLMYGIAGGGPRPEAAARPGGTPAPAAPHGPVAPTAPTAPTGHAGHSAPAGSSGPAGPSGTAPSGAPDSSGFAPPV